MFELLMNFCKKKKKKGWAAQAGRMVAATGAGRLKRAASALLLRSPRLPARELSAPARFYHKKVVDHYENPRNVGSLDKTSKNVGTGLVGAPACGDVMKLQVLTG